MAENRFINQYLLKLRPYRTASQEIWEKGPDERDEYLKLDWNEATIEPAPEVKRAVMDLVQSGGIFHLYPATSNAELLTLLSQYAGVPAENVQYFAGSDSVHEYLARAYVGNKDRVLILWPSYDNFRSTVEASGADVAYSDLGQGFAPDLGRLQADIDRLNPKVVYICNPNNPTGFLIGREDVERIVSDNQDTMFVIDEAYAEFARQTCNSLALAHENLLVTHTMSKAFALANIRFGYMVSSVSNVDAVSRIRNPKNIPTITQVAAAEALRHADYMWNYVREVELARDWFLDAIGGAGLAEWIKAYPSSGNFVLVQCRDIETRSRICYSLRRKKIFVRQLNQNASLLTCFRVTVGKRGQMRRVFDAIKQALCGG